MGRKRSTSQTETRQEGHRTPRADFCELDISQTKPSARRHRLRWGDPSPTHCARWRLFRSTTRHARRASAGTVTAGRRHCARGDRVTLLQQPAATPACHNAAGASHIAVTRRDAAAGADTLTHIVLFFQPPAGACTFAFRMCVCVLMRHATGVAVGRRVVCAGGRGGGFRVNSYGLVS